MFSFTESRNYQPQLSRGIWKDCGEDFTSLEVVKSYLGLSGWAENEFELQSKVCQLQKLYSSSLRLHQRDAPILTLHSGLRSFSCESHLPPSPVSADTVSCAFRRGCVSGGLQGGADMS